MSEAAARTDELVDRSQFLSAVLERLNSSQPNTRRAGDLIAAMICRQPHEWVAPFDLPCIPQWLIPDYLGYLLTPPPMFERLGEVDSYYDFACRWVDYLHSNVLGNPQSPFWREVGLAFVRAANCIPLYFTTANLREIYIKRAAIMEQVLRSVGLPTEHKFPARPADRKRIRLGIIATHLSPQTESYVTMALCRYMDRQRFETVIYTVQPPADELSRSFKPLVDHWIVLPASLQDQVATVRSHDLDIALMATNMSAVTNPVTLLGLNRLARIQITSVNSPVSTGMRHADYFISGSLMEPTDGQRHYSETLLTVEGQGICADAGPEVAPVLQSVKRESLGIRSDEVVYASGANFYKIIPEVEETWGRILSAVPNSRLLLYPFNPNWSNQYPMHHFLRRLHATMARHGIPEQRLTIFGPAAHRAEIRARLKVADVYLDTYPFSGFHSNLDPLEAGVPLLAHEGDSLRSRQGSAMLRELRMPEMIVGSEPEFVAMAVQLAHDAQMRHKRAAQVTEAMQRGPRFKDARFYSESMQKLFEGLAAKHFPITAS